MKDFIKNKIILKINRVPVQFHSIDIYSVCMPWGQIILPRGVEFSIGDPVELEMDWKKTKVQLFSGNIKDTGSKNSKPCISIESGSLLSTEIQAAGWQDVTGADILAEILKDNGIKHFFIKNMDTIFKRFSYPKQCLIDVIRKICKLLFLRRKNEFYFFIDQNNKLFIGDFGPGDSGIEINKGENLISQSGSCCFETFLCPLFFNQKVNINGVKHIVNYTHHIIKPEKMRTKVWIE